MKNKQLIQTLKKANIERKIARELEDKTCNCEKEVHLRWCNAFVAP